MATDACWLKPTRPPIRLEWPAAMRVLALELLMLPFLRLLPARPPIFRSSPASSMAPELEELAMIPPRFEPTRPPAP
ncbi:hypothetical protein D3C72_2398150 [compost metagenome]